MSRNVNVVITDLDNTLFDWFEAWFNSFSAMLDKLVVESGVSRDLLIQEIKSVHEKHGTSEYAFLIEELPSLRRLHPDGNLIEIYDESIHEFRRARKKHLRLYPTVLETLSKLKKKGVLIVGYTESMAFYTNYRVRILNLDDVLDFLYSPEDHDLPKGMTKEQIRKYPAESYSLQNCQHRHTPSGEMKPNSKVLLKIINDLGATPDQCIYIGDSLTKDIVMAQDAEVTDILVTYGKADHREEYELLRQVTHWTGEQVQHEKKISEKDVTPTFIMRKSFSELLENFNFEAFKGGKDGKQN